MIAHEKYDKIVSHGNDIGVIRLARSIDFAKANSDVLCVCSAKPMESVIADSCWVIGWGAIKESAMSEYSLREVQVPLRDQKYCAKHAVSKYDNSMLCAGFDQVCVYHVIQPFGLIFNFCFTFQFKGWQGCMSRRFGWSLDVCHLNRSIHLCLYWYRILWKRMWRGEQSWILHQSILLFRLDHSENWMLE